MESKSSSIHSKSIPPIDSPKKDIVGVVSEEIVTGIRSDLTEKSVDEDGGGRVSKGDDDGEVVRFLSPEKPWKIPSGMCRTCCITLDMEDDGRIGMSIDPQGGRVIVDGTGLGFVKTVNTSVNFEFGGKCPSKNFPS